MRNLILSATALTLVAGSAMAVEAKLYGVVNKALMVYDDGQTTESTIVDSNMESTRLGLGGEKKLDNGLTASVLLEMEMRSNPSEGLTQNGTGTFNSTQNTPANTGAAFAERIARVGLAHDTLGALFIGQQDLATDDVIFHDLAAASSVMNSNLATFGGGLSFRRDAAGVFSNLTAGGTTLNPGNMSLGLNGALDAADAIRYNSPNFMGFNGSASVAQGGTADLALRYAGELAGLSIDSAIGQKFINNNATTATDELAGQTFASASVKHSSGLAGTLAYTTQDVNHKSAGVADPEGWYAKVGYAWDNYGVAIDYGNFQDSIITATDTEMQSWGVGGEMAMGHGVSVGALYRNYDAEVAGISNQESIDVGVVNMRVKF